MDSVRNIRYTSVALDAQDRPFIAYGEDALRVARWDGATRVVDVVDSGGCTYAYPSLALDAAGHPAVSYFDRTAGHLKLARYD